MSNNNFLSTVSARSVYKNLEFVARRLDDILCKLERERVPAKSLSMLEAQYKASVVFFNNASEEDSAKLSDAILTVSQLLRTANRKNDELKKELEDKELVRAYMYSRRYGIETREKSESAEDFKTRVLATLAMKDPITASEMVIGKSWKEFSRAEEGFSLGLCLIGNRAKQAELKAAGDTTFSMSWQEYCEKVISLGFVKSYSYLFTSYYESYKEPEEYAVFYHPMGIVLCAESYMGYLTGSRNSAKLYFEIALTKRYNGLDNLESHWLYNILTGCSHGCCNPRTEEPAIIEVSFDAREGLVSFMSNLEMALQWIPGNLSNPWKMPRQHFLWFLDYSDCHDMDKRGINYEEVNARKISCFPEELKKLIGIKASSYALVKKSSCALVKVAA